MAAELHGLGTTTPGPDGMFASETVHAFQTEDKAAAKAIIFLMSGVFSLGLVGSMIISWACWK